MQVDTAGTDASEIKNSVKLVNESDVKPNLGLASFPRKLQPVTNSQMAPRTVLLTASKPILASDRYY